MPDIESRIPEVALSHSEYFSDPSRTDVETSPSMGPSHRWDRH